MTKPNGLYILGKHNLQRCYSDVTRAGIQELLSIPDTGLTPADAAAGPDILNDVEIIMSAWGGPHIDEDFLQHAPKLRAVFYAAGSIRKIVSDAFWKRDICISSAWAANAIPVAEYTLSQILWCLKRGHQFERRTRNGTWGKNGPPVFGVYESEVGIISLGMIGSYVCKLLKHFDVQVLAYAPFVSSERARELNVELVELDELFRRAAVVSLHAPNLPETRHMIQARHFEMMRTHAGFINTARGAIVDEPGMISVLEKRPDLQAVLDVTCPEPPTSDSPLFSLANVVLTPHIAGSLGPECHRLGAFMLEELRRYLADEPLRWQVTQEKAEIMA